MSSRLTPLETAAFDALADELRDSLPDLPGQIAESLAGVRRNIGQGFFTEVIVDRARPSPDDPITGRLGTLHGDVPGLVEPMAFQVEVVGGRVIALHGSTYDEPTSAIDFSAARVSGLFRIDERGNSVPWDPIAALGDSPLREMQVSDEPRGRSVWDGPPTPAVTISPSLPDVSPPASLDDAAATAREARVSLLIGLWTVIVVIMIVAMAVFRLSIITAGIIAFALGRMIHQPRVLALLQKAFDQGRALFDAAQTRR